MNFVTFLYILLRHSHLIDWRLNSTRFVIHIWIWALWKHGRHHTNTIWVYFHLLLVIMRKSWAYRFMHIMIILIIGKIKCSPIWSVHIMLFSWWSTIHWFSIRSVFNLRWILRSVKVPLPINILTIKSSYTQRILI